MPGANSHHQRKPGRNAKQKQEFRRLVQELKRVAFEHRYTRRDLALELGVSVAAINQWWIGYTPLAKPEHVERLKDFLEKGIDQRDRGQFHDARLPSRMILPG